MSNNHNSCCDHCHATKRIGILTNCQDYQYDRAHASHFDTLTKSASSQCKEFLNAKVGAAGCCTPASLPSAHVGCRAPCKATTSASPHIAQYEGNIHRWIIALIVHPDHPLPVPATESSHARYWARYGVPVYTEASEDEEDARVAYARAVAERREMMLERDQTRRKRLFARMLQREGQPVCLAGVRDDTTYLHYWNHLGLLGARASLPHLPAKHMPLVR